MTLNYFWLWASSSRNLVPLSMTILLGPLWLGIVMHARIPFLKKQICLKIIHIILDRVKKKTLKKQRLKNLNMNN